MDAAKPGSKWGIATLGHPCAKGYTPRRGEYLGEGPTRGPRTITVGSGVSKYTSEKEFKPWNPNNVKIKAARKRK